MKYVSIIFLGLLSLVFAGFSFSERMLTGSVTDENGTPIPFASIQIKGSNATTGTDGNGHFTIKVHDNDILIITAVGFAQKEVNVRKQNQLLVKLSPVQQNLAENVVIGYGTASKKRLSEAEALSVAHSAPVGMNRQGAGIMIRGKQNPRPVRGDGWRYNPNFDREGYDQVNENPFLKVHDNPLSTFSIDVDGASYSNVRRFLNLGQLPPDGSVRIEEMINYFSYNYPQPAGDAPFSINTEYAICPWNTQHQLVSIGLQGKKINTDNLPPSNIVFLIDVSGSMDSPDKLPLVQASMKLLTDQLRPQDKVAIVVYAGKAGVVLPATDGNDKIKIKQAIDGLQAGGSTAGGEGIQLAYQIATENFITKGNNRVVLCTDGDFNVGVSSDAALEKLIEQKRATGIYLSVLGYGTGNYQDAKMQKLAQKGNGNHAYIDNLNEARKVLIHQFGGTLFTIAKDVKLQIEFNPAKVQGYRLIGYENRMLAKEDFNDDKKDAGELGSGHTVTALYEIIPAGIPAPELKSTDALKYQKPATAEGGNKNNEIMTVKFRYKKPESDKSLLLQKVVAGAPANLSAMTENLRVAAAVAQFGMLLQNSEFKGEGGFGLVNTLLLPTLKNDKEGYRRELQQLVQTTSRIVSSEDVKMDGVGFEGNRRRAEQPGIRVKNARN